MRHDRSALRSGYADKYPALARRRQPPAPVQSRKFDCVLLGHDQSGQPLYLPDVVRLEHMSTYGTTGSGKTTYYKNVVLQDVARGRGGMVLDPHGSHPGSLYSEAVAELHGNGFFDTGRIHLLDPNHRQTVIPINPLARLHDTDISVLSDALVKAFEVAWGDEDTHQKPTIRTMLSATFMALAELGLPLADAKLLYDAHDTHGLRARVIARLSNEYPRDELQRLHTTALDERSKRDFRAEVIGPINRVNEFLRSDTLRAMFGVVDEPGMPRRTLDLLDILERGDWLFVNLSHGAAVSEADANLLGAILLRYLFLLAPRRNNREPFFVHVDEAHRFMVGDDLPSLFAESRKYGIAMHVGLQFEAQAGDADGLIAQAIDNCTEIKNVFRVRSPTEAQRHAERVIPLTLERPLKASIRPTVVGQRRVRMPTYAHSTQEAESTGEAETLGEMDSHTEMHSYSEGIAEMSSTTTGTSTSDGVADSTGMVLTPAATLFGPNNPGASFMGQAPLSESTGHLTSHGSSEQSAASTGTSRTSSESHGTATTTARSRAATTSRSRLTGKSEAHGWHETNESVFADLPASYHSKEAELYFAGEMIRQLPTGQCFVAYRGKTTRISIPAPKRKS